MAMTAKNPKRNRASVSGRLYTLLMKSNQTVFLTHNSIGPFFIDDSPRKCFSLKSFDSARKLNSIPAICPCYFVKKKQKKKQFA